MDSPVTGAVDGARTGRLTLFAGGAPDVVQAVTPILSELGRVIACGKGRRILFVDTATTLAQLEGTRYLY